MRISDWSSDVCSSDLQPQVRPQRTLGVERQRKRGVALQTSFVRFVEQHGGNTGKLRVGLNAVREYALGDHFYPRRGRGLAVQPRAIADRSEEHTSELQSLMRISYAVFCLKKQKTTKHNIYRQQHNRQN